MDWRLQGAGLAAGIIFAELPNLFGPNYTGNLATFVSSWNTIISAMQYLVIVSLVLVILGMIWRGPIGRPSAWIQMFISFGLGSWMFLGLTFLGFWPTDSGSCSVTRTPLGQPPDSNLE